MKLKFRQEFFRLCFLLGLVVLAIPYLNLLWSHNKVAHAQTAIPCTTSPCSFSINYPFDSAGTPDKRPGTWGAAAFDDGKIQFQNVPTGYRVRIERVYGDFVAWPHGNVKSGKYAGILFGLLATSNGASPYATLSASGCPLYLQHVVGANGVRGSFDVNTHAAGLLAADSTLLVRRAIFLNETGASIHQEPSMVVVFTYEPAQ